MNRQITSNGFLLATRRAKYLAGSICGALILDLFDYILSSREVSWFQIDYKQIQLELLDYEFSVKTIQRNIQSLEDKKLILSQVFKNKQKKYSLNYELINSFEIPNKFNTSQNDHGSNCPEVKLSRGQNDQKSICPEPQVKLSSVSGQNDSSLLIYKIQNTSFNTDNEQKNKEIALNQNGSIASDLSNQSSLTKIDQDLKPQPLTQNKDHFSPQVDYQENQNNKSRVNKNFGEWIPDGPWLKISDSGRRYLDHNFVEYRAKKFFVKQFGDELPEAISKQIKYYKNDTERLVIDWEEYHHSTLAIAASIQAYTKSTGQIKQTDVEKLESIYSGFQSLPENLQSTNRPVEFKPLIAQTSSTQINSTEQKNVNLPVENSKTMNTTLTLVKPSNFAENSQKITKEEEATPEQKAEFFNAFHKMFGKSKRTSSAVKKQHENSQKVKSRLEILNQQLKDRILRPYVIQEVNNSDKYYFIYNELTSEPEKVVKRKDVIEMQSFAAPRN